MPRPPSVRRFSVIGCSGKAPLATVTRPPPSATDPSQTAFARSLFNAIVRTSITCRACRSSIAHPPNEYTHGSLRRQRSMVRRQRDPPGARVAAGLLRFPLPCRHLHLFAFDPHLQLSLRFVGWRALYLACRAVELTAVPRARHGASVDFPPPPRAAPPAPSGAAPDRRAGNLRVAAPPSPRPRAYGVYRWA